MVASAVRKRVRRPAKAHKATDWYYVQELQKKINGDGYSEFFGNFDSLDEGLAWSTKDARHVLRGALKDLGPAGLASIRRHYAKEMSQVVIRNATDAVAVVKFRIQKGELVVCVYDLADCVVRAIPVTL